MPRGKSTDKKDTKKKSLLDRLKDGNKVKGASILSKSKFFEDEFHDTGIKALNLALSSKMDGGFSRGATIITGLSKTFKTMFMLQMVKSYMDTFDDSIFIFYDVEFGTNQGTFESIGIDPSRVLHKPITNIEELTNDFTNLFEGENAINEKDNVIIGVDSFGAIASKKQQDDAKSGSEKADMTRAKRIRNFWTIANPKLNINKIPLIGIGQIYRDQSVQYPKYIVGGGEAMEYYPNNIWMISKSQLKDSSGKFIGSSFTINVHKGRFTKEKSKFPINVTYEEGIDPYSSLLDIALDMGYVKKKKFGTAYYYFHSDDESTKKRIKDTSTAEYWDPILNDPKFQEDVHKKFSLGSIEEVESTGEVVEGGYEEQIVTDDPSKPKTKKKRSYNLKKKEDPNEGLTSEDFLS